MIASLSSCDWTFIRSLITLSIRVKPIRNWFWRSSPTARILRLPRWSISSVLPTPFARLSKYETVAKISSMIMWLGIRSSWRSLISATSASWSSPTFSIISERTRYDTFSLIASSFLSTVTYLSMSTMPLERTLITLPDSSLRSTDITPAFSISSAFSAVIFSPASARSSPIGEITGSAKIWPVIRSSKPSFLLYLYLPTLERSYLLESKNKPSRCALAVSTVGGSPGRSFL